MEEEEEEEDQGGGGLKWTYALMKGRRRSEEKPTRGRRRERHIDKIFVLLILKPLLIVVLSCICWGRSGGPNQTNAA